jgi:hypothetical protein
VLGKRNDIANPSPEKSEIGLYDVSFRKFIVYIMYCLITPLSRLVNGLVEPVVLGIVDTCFRQWMHYKVLLSACLLQHARAPEGMSNLYVAFFILCSVEKEVPRRYLDLGERKV